MHEGAREPMTRGSPPFAQSCGAVKMTVHIETMQSELYDRSLLPCAVTGKFFKNE